MSFTIGSTVYVSGKLREIVTYATFKDNTESQNKTITWHAYVSSMHVHMMS